VFVEEGTSEGEHRVRDEAPSREARSVVRSVSSELSKDLEREGGRIRGGVRGGEAGERGEELVGGHDEEGRSEGGRWSQLGANRGEDGGEEVEVFVVKRQKSSSRALLPENGVG